ncbi:MAG: hypothetical protein ABUL64_04065, partial [Singulisphaera sp.]
MKERREKTVHFARILSAATSRDQSSQSRGALQTAHLTVENRDRASRKIVAMPRCEPEAIFPRGPWPGPAHSPPPDALQKRIEVENHVEPTMDLRSW